MNKSTSPIDPVEPDDAPTDMAVSRKDPDGHVKFRRMQRSIEKYKAIFVVRGFSQKEGVDYDETFAHVA